MKKLVHNILSRMIAKVELTEYEELLQDIQLAHKQWCAAQKALDFAVETDQIDCAIYAMIAAQRRYEMLLRQAKRYKASQIEHAIV